MTTTIDAAQSARQALSRGRQLTEGGRPDPRHLASPSRTAPALRLATRTRSRDSIPAL
jgi:hypothetical protein